jgi:prepilin-type processing-associated H-X9-DG protein
MFSIVDGATNTIMLAENPDLEEWNFAPTEIHVCIVWDDLNYPSPRQSLAGSIEKRDTLLNLYNQGAEYVLPHARPSSFHPNGFMVAFCDGHVRFLSQTVAYEVYMHLMTSHGRAYQPAGMKTLPPPPLPPTLTNNAVQNVFQGTLDDSSF